MAAKKSIKDTGADAFSELMGGKDAKDVQDAQSTHNAQEPPEEMARLNLKIPKRIKDYLYEASWKESTPTRRVSVTAYLVELVERDMQEHGGE